MEVEGSRVRMYTKLYFGDPYLLTPERSPLVQSTFREFLSVTVAAGEERGCFTSLDQEIKG